MSCGTALGLKMPDSVDRGDREAFADVESDLVTFFLYRGLAIHK